jgi:DNA-directed RNA polymerase specialized sigma24 family protein
MIKHILSGVPECVRITILAQIKRLRSYSCFSKDDTEDIMQELLVTYLNITAVMSNAPESYLVASLQNKATSLLKARARIGFGLFSSLEDIEAFEEYPSTKTGFEGLDYKIIMDSVLEHFDDRSRRVVRLMLEDVTIDEISRREKMSKSTIYKVLKEMEKRLKK